MFVQAGKPIALVDHHPDPETWFTLPCTRIDASSAAEMVYDLVAGHDAGLIDRAVATGDLRRRDDRHGLVPLLGDDAAHARHRSRTCWSGATSSPSPSTSRSSTGARWRSLRLLSAALATIQTHYDGRFATIQVSQNTVHQTRRALRRDRGPRQLRARARRRRRGVHLSGAAERRQALVPLQGRLPDQRLGEPLRRRRPRQRLGRLRRPTAR